MATKLRWYIKHQSKGAVNTLLIPTTDDNGATAWTTMLDTDEIYRLIVERNTGNLSIPNTSPFTQGPLADDICLYVDNDVVDKIRDGSATHDTL